jgi:transposase
MDISTTFWLDESSRNTGMTRLYGRSFSGERVIDYVPDVRFERTSILGVLGLNGIIAPFVYNGSLNGELFRAYVSEILIPALKNGDTLILDNLSVHKVKGVLQPLTDKGINIAFLPPYSPDYNPIELAWSKIKAYLRKVKVRLLEALPDVICDILDTIAKSDARGWIKHCGYGL